MGDDEAVVKVDVAVVQDPQVFVSVESGFVLADFCQCLGNGGGRDAVL